MELKKENAQRDMGVEQNKNDFISIFADASVLIKSKNHHSQEITTPDGVALHIVLEDATVFITDKNENTVSFLAHLFPEILATFHDVEKVFYKGIGGLHGSS